LQRNILLLSVFLFLAAAIWLDRSVIHKFVVANHQVKPVNDVNDWDKYNEKSFIVVKVVDGDTIDINIPDGNWPDTRIRLLGIDTPETEKSPTGAMYYGKEASEFTAKTVLAQEVSVIMDKLSKTRDKYNRLLCHIRLADGKILNEELIRQGFAYADTRFPHSYFEKYIKLEKTAQKQKKGLWKKVTPEQMPEWHRKTKN